MEESGMGERGGEGRRNGGVEGCQELYTYHVPSLQTDTTELI